MDDNFFDSLFNDDSVSNEYVSKVIDDEKSNITQSSKNSNLDSDNQSGKQTTLKATVPKKINIRHIKRIKHTNTSKNRSLKNRRLEIQDKILMMHTQLLKLHLNLLKNKQMN